VVYKTRNDAHQGKGLLGGEGLVMMMRMMMMMMMMMKMMMMMTMMMKTKVKAGESQGVPLPRSGERRGESSSRPAGP
jgi:hypothetical protein